MAGYRRGDEWTDEEVALVEKLWTEGLSASQIAQRLRGRTRNAVIGIVHRRGWSCRQLASEPKRAKPAQTRAAPSAPKPARPVLTVVARAPQLPPVPEMMGGPDSPPAEAAADLVTPKTLAEREPGECAWPVDGGRNEQLYCAAPCNGRRYCDHHAAIGRSASSPKPLKTSGWDWNVRSADGRVRRRDGGSIMSAAWS